MEWSCPWYSGATRRPRLALCDVGAPVVAGVLEACRLLYVGSAQSAEAGLMRWRGCADSEDTGAQPCTRRGSSCSLTQGMARSVGDVPLPEC